MNDRRMLKFGKSLMRGDDVCELQRKLQTLGYAITDIDGIFGAETEHAVRAFQAASGLMADGIVGPNTWRTIDEACTQLESETSERETSDTPGPQTDSEDARSRPFASESTLSTPETIPSSSTSTAAVELGQQPERNALRNAAHYIGLSLTTSAPRTEASRTAVCDLQRHLRALGYLRAGIDGVFGSSTERAVRALQYDLIHNDGRDAHGGSDAPIALVDINNGRVTDITGIADDDTVVCIQALIENVSVPLLPFSDNPRNANERVRNLISEWTTDRVPLPFLCAILEQESNGQHFREPRSGDEDTYITIGLDTNDADHPHHITSRGYGAGQYTLFHHPPRQEEVEQFMQSVSGNVQHAIDELRDKFDRFIKGATSGTRADDRIAEHGTGPLRLCQYASEDFRHLRDCANCMRESGTTIIEADATPFHPNTQAVYSPTQYHNHTRMDSVPVRSAIECDWPYATRRYNGSGVDSYWYQAEVLSKIAVT